MAGQLNARQAAFIREYLKDYNASKAYVRAGYVNKNPNISASRLLNSPAIREALRPIDQAVQTETNKVVDKWREEVNKIAFANISDPASLTYDHKIKGLDLLAKVDGRYQSESGFTQAFQINIHLGGDDKE